MRRGISRVLYWCALMVMESAVRAVCNEVQELGMDAYEANHLPEVKLRADLHEDGNHDHEPA